MKRLFGIARKEPLGLAGIIVAIAALLPSYFIIWTDKSYTFSFYCTEVGLESEAIFVKNEHTKDFVAVRTQCDFSNLDSQTISIKKAGAVARFRGDPNSTIPLSIPDNKLPENSDFRLLSRSVAHNVQSGETLLFDEFYLIPIEGEPRQKGPDCSNIPKGEFVPFSHMMNCFPDLNYYCLEDYLNGMNFWGGAGGTNSYRALAIKLTLTNNVHAIAPMSLEAHLKGFSKMDKPEVNCPNPDKTL
jgi:hypothetical protein